jgi:hypothetical protein
VDKLHIVASIIRSAARMLEKDVVDLPSLKKILNKQQIPWGTFLAQANAAVRTSRMHPMQDPDDRWQNEQDMRVVQDHLPSTTRTDRLTLSRR